MPNNYLTKSDDRTHEVSRPLIPDVIDGLKGAQILPTYLSSGYDADTGDDAIPTLEFNALGMTDVDKVPSQHAVRRNWRPIQGMVAGNSLNVYFTDVPENDFQYLWKNGNDMFQTPAIQSMADIPAFTGVTGLAYLRVETYNRSAIQYLYLPDSKRYFQRERRDNNTLTEWVELLNSESSVELEKVTGLFDELLTLSNLIFDTNAVNFTQSQQIQAINSQLLALAQINNTQDTMIQQLLIQLGLAFDQLIEKVSSIKLNGGLPGQVLAKLSGADQDYAFQYVHGARLLSFSAPKGQVGVAYNFTIGPDKFLIPDFIFEPLTVSFSTYPEEWFDAQYSPENGIKVTGTPTVGGRYPITVYLKCNKHVYTYQIYILIDAVTPPIAVPPYNLLATVSSVDPLKVHVTWENDGTVDNFKLQRRLRTAGTWGAWTTITSPSNAARSFDDTSATGLAYDSAYEYRTIGVVGGVDGTPSNSDPETTPVQVVLTGGLYGRYYNGTNLSGEPVGVQVDPVIEFNWTGISPITGLGANDFSVRESGFIVWPTSGTIQLRTRSDDGVRVWIDGVQMVDNWTTHSIEYGVNVFNVALVAGVQKAIVIEYFQGDGDAKLYFEYNDNGTWKTVPSDRLVPQATEGNSVPAPILGMTVVDNDTINIDWTYTHPVDTFEYSFSESGNFSTGRTDGVFGATERNFTFNGLQANFRYYSRIRASYQGRLSEWSNIVNGKTTGTTTPPALSNTARRIVWMSPSIDFNPTDANDIARNNAVIARAQAAKVTHVTLFIAWWEMEQGEDSYDFGELRWRMKFLADRGFASIVVMPHRFAATPDRAVSGSVQHRWNGTSFTTTGFIGQGSCNYISHEHALGSREGRQDISGVEGANGSPFSSVYKTRLKKLAAKMCHYIYTDSYLASLCGDIMFVNGGSSETGLSTAAIETSPGSGVYEQTDFNWTNQTNQDFQNYLLNIKYSNLANLNTAWGGINTIADVYPPRYRPQLYLSGGLGVVVYNENVRTRDWYRYLLYVYQTLYYEIVAVFKNPHNYDASLVNTDTSGNTPFTCVAYLTDRRNAAQAMSWAAGVLSLVCYPFDEIWSSIGSLEGPSGGVDTYLKAFGVECSVIRGTSFGKTFMVEMDNDNLTWGNQPRVSFSKLARCVCAQGGRGVIVTFHRTAPEWDYSLVGDDGTTRTMEQDVLRAYQAYIKDKNVTMPTVNGTTEYSLNNFLDNISDPNGVHSRILSECQFDADGMTTNGRYWNGAMITDAYFID